MVDFLHASQQTRGAGSVVVAVGSGESKNDTEYLSS
jgi:hypothetical protein